MTKRFTHVPPGKGNNYHWANDHTFIKISAADTGGAYTLVEDNMKATFQLGLHIHRQHAETFYILEGSMDFRIDGEWVIATPGTVLHIPPGVPHGTKISAGSDGARMLMIMQPSGFDGFMEELSGLTDADMADADLMTEISERHDIFQIGPLPDGP